MKYISLYVLCLWSVGLVQAQQFSFGPVFGSSDAYMTNNRQQTQLYPVLGGGLTFSYNTAGHIGAGADVKYTMEGFKAVETVNNSTVTTTLDARYLRIPLKLQYHFREQGKKVRPRLAAGLAFGILQGGTKSYRDKAGDLLLSEPAKEVLETFDTGLHGSAGLQIRIFKKVWLITDVTYYHGLLKLNKYGNNVMRHVNMGLNAGVLLGFGGEE